MKIAVAAFTDNGIITAHRIFDSWEGNQVDYRPAGEKLESWVDRNFEDKAALVFVGAVGIAVRAIAPRVRDKLEDSPVVVVDELGINVIPLLSGHVGGANELAGQIAVSIGARPVITTATDLNNRFAVDVWAEKNRLRILNKEGIAKVSGKVLAGSQILMSLQGSCADPGKCEQEGDSLWTRLPEEVALVDYPPSEPVDVIVSTERAYDEWAKLALCPKEYIIGIGCKKGKSAQEIADLVGSLKIDLEQVALVASIDLKKDEAGIIQFCNRNRLKFVTYRAEELTQLEGDFSSSDFVKSRVGVDNVCERAAMKASDSKGEIVIRKQAHNGITIALVKDKWRFNFE